MTHKDFDKLVDYVVTERIKNVMCQKSTEYARGGDKLYNFKRAAKISGETPLVCLRGMKLKHDVSILDMLDDEDIGLKTPHTREKWEEKIGDDINYLILMLALLYEKHEWEIPGAETKPGYGDDVEKNCFTCDNNVMGEPVCGHCNSNYSKWEPKK